MIDFGKKSYNFYDSKDRKKLFSSFIKLKIATTIKVDLRRKKKNFYTIFTKTDNDVSTRELN